MTSWPTPYDDDYLPKPNQKFWFPRIERLSPERREKIIVRKLRAQLNYAFSHARLYHRKWKEAGFDPRSVRALRDLGRCPFIRKEDIRQDQAENPPFGSYLCVPPAQILRIHGTSGTTGKQTVFAISRGDWRRIANAHARVMWGFGIRPQDRVMIASIFSLYIGSWGALAGTERLGATAFPFGAGLPGQTKIGVGWCKEVKPSVFYSTPSYALYFAGVAREEGLDPRSDFQIRTMFFSGEPGASVPSVKRRIEEAFGCICVDTGSTAEMTPWMSNGGCGEEIGMHLWQDVVYAEVVDPETGEVVDYGEEGVLVYTHLERDSQPMIRFWSNDLATWNDEPCACGRTYPRLTKGIYGRLDDMFIVRGENVFPSAVQEALESIEAYGGEHRIVITREREMDLLTIQAEYHPSLETADEQTVGRLRSKMEEEVKARCGVRAVIQLVPPQTFPRTEFKARRVVDKRELYEELKSLRNG